MDCKSTQYTTQGFILEIHKYFSLMTIPQITTSLFFKAVIHQQLNPPTPSGKRPRSSSSTSAASELINSVNYCKVHNFYSIPLYFKLFLLSTPDDHNFLLYCALIILNYLQYLKRLIRAGPHFELITLMKMLKYISPKNITWKKSSLSDDSSFTPY